MAGDATSLSFNSVMRFREGVDGAIWVATDGGGLNRFDRAAGKFARFTSQTSNLNSDAVLAIDEDKAGRIWIGTWRGGISRFDPRSGRFTPYTTKNSGLTDDGVFAVHVDKAGQLWIGTNTKGLQRLDPERGTFTSYRVTQGEGSQIRVITEASDGVLFLGTVLQGIVAFDPRTGASRWYRAGKGGISSNQIAAVLEAEPGVIWVGSAGGLDRIDRRVNTIQHFAESDGVPEGAVAGLAIDAAQQLWISGDRGVTRFDPATKKATAYTIADGLQGT
jgi:ligand-binding sensor domain-containing protein